MSPVRALRESLAQSSQHKELATQAAFARLVGRSESLIRGIERKRVPVSRKLAKELASIFKVSVDWLMQEDVSEADIPALDPEDVIEWAVQNPAVTRIIDIGEVPPVRVRPGKNFEPDPRKRIRQKMIRSVMIGMDDLFDACSDEELAVVTSELREWLYARLAMMAKSQEPTESQCPSTDSLH